MILSAYSTFRASHNRTLRSLEPEARYRISPYTSSFPNRRGEPWGNIAKKETMISVSDCGQVRYCQSIRTSPSAAWEADRTSATAAPDAAAITAAVPADCRPKHTDSTTCSCPRKVCMVQYVIFRYAQCGNLKVLKTHLQTLPRARSPDNYTMITASTC